MAVLRHVKCLGSYVAQINQLSKLFVLMLAKNKTLTIISENQACFSAFF